MNKFALLGRNISHSKSPEIYRRLISPTIQYDLLDFGQASEIPEISALLKEYDGINITTPYKEHFLNHVQLSEKARAIGAINCLKKSNGHFYGENTDYFAVVDGLKSLQARYGQMEISILGDGVMSRVVQLALKDLNQTAKVYSRKLTENFSHLNLNNINLNISTTPLIINACSRDYVFSGELPRNSVFWDFNYSFPSHSSQLPSKIYEYLDGYEMLERQAFYAVAFWFNRKFS